MRISVASSDPLLAQAIYGVHQISPHPLAAAIKMLNCEMSIETTLRHGISASG